MYSLFYVLWSTLHFKIAICIGLQKMEFIRQTIRYFALQFLMIFTPNKYADISQNQNSNAPKWLRSCRLYVVVPYCMPPTKLIQYHFDSGVIWHCWLPFGIQGWSQGGVQSIHSKAPWLSKHQENALMQDMIVIATQIWQASGSHVQIHHIHICLTMQLGNCIVQKSVTCISQLFPRGDSIGFLLVTRTPGRGRGGESGICDVSQVMPLSAH